MCLIHIREKNMSGIRSLLKIQVVFVIAILFVTPSFALTEGNPSMNISILNYNYLLLLE